MPESGSCPGTKLPARWLPGCILFFGLLLLAAPARAHRVLIYAFAEGDTIHTESKFIPDTPVRQGKILVMDKKTDKVLLTGRTDDQGKFSFKIPAAAAKEKLDLRIVVEAAMGHQGEWLLKASSYLPGAQAASAAPASPAPAPAAAKEAPGPRGPAVDPSQVEAAVNKALERQLAPIKEMLTQLTIHRTSLTDVIGGLGYILGIFGLWAYFQSRRKKDS